VSEKIPANISLSRLAWSATVRSFGITVVRVAIGNESRALADFALVWWKKKSMLFARFFPPRGVLAQNPSEIGPPVVGLF
jgi:hypothetical protein